MKHQKVIHFLDNEITEQSNFRTKIRVEINDDARETHNTNSHIKYQRTILNSSFCDYGDAYILDKGVIVITGVGASAIATQSDEIDKQVIFKNWTPFTDCVSKINNRQDEKMEKT